MVTNFFNLSGDETRFTRSFVEYRSTGQLVFLEEKWLSVYVRPLPSHSSFADGTKRYKSEQGWINGSHRAFWKHS